MSLLFIAEAEVLPVVAWFFFFNAYFFDIRADRTFMAKLNDLADFGFRAFEMGFNRAIVQISDPAGDVVSFGKAVHKIPEPYPLYTAFDLHTGGCGCR